MSTGNSAWDSWTSWRAPGDKGKMLYLPLYSFSHPQDYPFSYYGRGQSAYTCKHTGRLIIPQSALGPTPWALCVNSPPKRTVAPWNSTKGGTAYLTLTSSGSSQCSFRCPLLPRLDQDLACHSLAGNFVLSHFLPKEFGLFISYLIKCSALQGRRGGFMRVQPERFGITPLSLCALCCT